jgi:hypothetical protein
MNPLAALAGLTKIKFISERVAELRKQAREQLRSVKVSSGSQSHALDAATAEVVSESENVVQQEGTVEWYYLTQVVRNEAGEYFLLKTTDTSPFIKHLAQSRAKLVLKDKYKAPTHAAPQGDA